MIRHVVMWVFPEESAGRSREDNVLRAYELLQALPEAIDVIDDFAVLRDHLGGEKQADLMIDSTFADWDALEVYQQHPAHLEVVAFFREAGTTRWAIDHEVA